MLWELVLDHTDIAMEMPMQRKLGRCTGRVVVLAGSYQQRCCSLVAAADVVLVITEELGHIAQPLILLSKRGGASGLLLILGWLVTDGRRREHDEVVDSDADLGP
jgi:hypothetical protein